MANVSEKLVARVMEKIREDEVVDLALALSQIDSPTGGEGPVSDYIYNWCAEQGFSPKRLGLFPDRCNILGRLKGVGGGKSLIFNSHMDTTIEASETLTTLKAADPIFHSAWREGKYLYGNGILNNKGPMATWMIACKALKESGVKLMGDVLMTMVVGEIGLEPVDEFQPPKYIAKEAGARYLVTRGAYADYAIVCEGTDFTAGWVEAGKLFFKISVLGHDLPIYTPYIKRPTSIEESPNAIVRASKVIQALEDWAMEYETKNTYECPGGTVIPKVSVGAIRSGVPYKITKTPGVCQMYLDIRILPGADPVAVEQELREVLNRTGIPCEVEPFVYRPGYEAKGVEPLVAQMATAHQRVFGKQWEKPLPPVTSMWRDSNVFIEAGIPTVIYGPGGSVGGGVFAMEITNLVRGAQVYAQMAMEICGVEG